MGSKDRNDVWEARVRLCLAVRQNGGAPEPCAVVVGSWSHRDLVCTLASDRELATLVVTVDGQRSEAAVWRERAEAQAAVALQAARRRLRRMPWGFRRRIRTTSACSTLLRGSLVAACLTGASLSTSPRAAKTTRLKVACSRSFA